MAAKRKPKTPEKKGSTWNPVDHCEALACFIGKNVIPGRRPRADRAIGAALRILEVFYPDPSLPTTPLVSDIVKVVRTALPLVRVVSPDEQDRLREAVRLMMGADPVLARATLERFKSVMDVACHDGPFGGPLSPMSDHSSRDLAQELFARYSCASLDNTSGMLAAACSPACEDCEGCEADADHPKLDDAREALAGADKAGAS